MSLQQRTSHKHLDPNHLHLHCEIKCKNLSPFLFLLLANHGLTAPKANLAAQAEFEKLTYRFRGRDIRLTDVDEKVIKDILL